MTDEDRLYLTHIAECIGRIEEYTARGREHFMTSHLIQDGVPVLPGCISQGDTRQQALDNIQEAIALYLESVDED